MKGYIKLQRELTQKEFYNCVPFERSRALLDLILLASYKERTIRTGKTEVNIKPGELAYSADALAKRWKRSRHFVMDTLKEFKLKGIVEVKTTRRTTIIRITEWDKYRSKTENNSPDKSVLQVPQAERAQIPEKLNDRNPETSDPEAGGLASFLISGIRKNDPYLVIPNGARWDLEIRKLLNEYGIPPEELRRMIELSQKHAFWKKYINSPSALRLHFHTLYILLNEEKKNNEPVLEEWRLCYER